MKCIKNADGKIKRVKNEQASALVASGTWVYCSKQEWKEQGRPNAD